MSRSGERGEPADTGATLLATERWFVQHGLPYFVPEEREAARRALHSRRTLVMLVLTVLVALGGGVALAALLGQVALAPAVLMLLAGLAVLGYGATTLRARPIASFAVRRTLGSLRLLLPLATRALPLLMLFITFLFINAEVWQLAASMGGATLWLTVMLFGLFAVLFLFVRLPEELDSVDAQMDATRLAEACRRTPLEGLAGDSIESEAARDRATVSGFERANLILVLVIAQAVQVFLLALCVFTFFMMFGALVMDDGVQLAWTQREALRNAPVLTHLSLELFQVSIFLAAFSGLYFTVCAVTDEAYRDQFFTQVKEELDRSVGVRAVYLALRQHSETSA
ncbi:MAG: hypothetical protein WBQ50_05310 [Nocardioides sp.]